MPQSQVPAAIYLRMSTEHQQYSLHNQRDAIDRYAEEHGFAVVQSYSDAAKSGLVLKRRNGLRQLLQDVVSTHEFKVILVYDVSRWGRFQDTDEAAHYEFICKSAGVPVHYCAETFLNDGSLTSLIMKALKRTMAGEYSRELSVKVYAGQKRLAQLGFKQGGCPGYGLRRLLLGPDRKPKQRLDSGERKSLATDRVILTPGPREEVRVVRRIYKRLLEGKTVYSIARSLNREGVPYTRGSKWDYMAVFAILTHPKYMGCHVYGRTSQKLKTPVVRLPQSQWVLTPGAFEPLVSHSTFLAVQYILAERTYNKSDQELLDRLKALWKQEGRLSLSMLKRFEGVPKPSVLRCRFGGFMRACELIGYSRIEQFGPSDLRRRTQLIRKEMIFRIHAMFPEDVALVQPGGRWRIRLMVRGCIPVSVLISRFLHVSKRGGPQWVVDPIRDEADDITLLLRLNQQNSAVEDLYVLPRIDCENRKQLSVDDERIGQAIQLPDIAGLVDAVVVIHEARTQSA